MNCKWCNKEILKIRSNRNNTKFCSRKCYLEFHKIERYQNYLKDNSIIYGQQNIQNFKKFFLEEQNNKCVICGISNLWNNKKLIFILDHIDGNADNNNRNNLRLICPNCDSQLDTYKSKNKNSARTKYKKIIKMEPYNRNIISEHNDNVEFLTDNADDNDVGIEETLAARE